MFLVGSVIPNRKEIKCFWVGDFLAVWCLRLSASKAGDAGSVPGWETEITQTTWCGLKKKKVSGLDRLIFNHSIQRNINNSEKFLSQIITLEINQVWVFEIVWTFMVLLMNKQKTLTLAEPGGDNNLPSTLVHWAGLLSVCVLGMVTGCPGDR